MKKGVEMVNFWREKADFKEILKNVTEIKY